MRYCQEVSGVVPAFESKDPDCGFRRRLIDLVRSCGLSHAAPEALETPEGEMVFIDLNPYGDWRGFFGRRREAEIAAALASTIKITAKS